LKEFSRVGAIDSVTLQILLEKENADKSTQTPNLPINTSVSTAISSINQDVRTSINPTVSTQRLRMNDVPRLKRAIEVKGPFTYGKWAIVLDFETKAPQSAVAWLDRMERHGFLQLTKSENGVSVTATDLALKALKLLDPTDSGRA
jgi:hypothetical protein